jgi:DNA-binding MarR family transcriptional regulator
MPTRSTPAKKTAGGKSAARATSPRKQDAAVQALRRFRIVFNAVRAHFRAVETEAGISGAQLWALSVIRNEPGIAVGELARAMDVHQSTASNLLRALQEAGMVMSDRIGEDRRQVQLTVTPKGLQALAVAPGPFTGILPVALRRLDPAVLVRLNRDLDLLVAELHSSRRAAKIPLGAGEEESGKPPQKTAARR